MGKSGFYYKGRMKGKWPGETKMGVAFSDSPSPAEIELEGEVLLNAGQLLEVLLS